MSTLAAPGPETIVWVRRQWNERHRAAYRLADLSGLHWSDMSGGVMARANRPYVHGYASCEAAVEGEVAHSCRHGSAPHRIKVCVTAVDNGGVRSPLVRHLRGLAS
ncbi:hypothetical protein [Pseudonocardia alni]|uniref:Uncharacterized protein n=1 Tax=Pseudonocardia alni TaxID=33907 RepID=A0A852VTP5_PSEA5|nr:hypothetical protein [Pseudonocardia antarctica]NYG00358.1 hypothetical protein [Pseudonocardia antarctica]